MANGENLLDELIDLRRGIALNFPKTPLQSIPRCILSTLLTLLTLLRSTEFDESDRGERAQISAGGTLDVSASADLQVQTTEWTHGWLRVARRSQHAVHHVLHAVQTVRVAALEHVPVPTERARAHRTRLGVLLRRSSISVGKGSLL